VLPPALPFVLPFVLLSKLLISLFGLGLVAPVKGQQPEIEHDRKQNIRGHFRIQSREFPGSIVPLYKRRCERITRVPAKEHLKNGSVKEGSSRQT
jgi:hypothetical protein